MNSDLAGQYFLRGISDLPTLSQSILHSFEQKISSDFLTMNTIKFLKPTNGSRFISITYYFIFKEY